MRQQKLTRFVLVASLAIAGVAVAGSGETDKVDVTGATGAKVTFLKDTKAAPGTFRISKIVDAEVYDSNGKDLGKVKDIVLDRGYDRIAYTIVSYGGVAGIGEKLAALPYRALKLGGPADEKVYVQMSEDAIKKAPVFDDSKWPSEANVDYYRSLDAYYSTKLGEAPVVKEGEAQVAAATLAEPSELPWTRRATKLIGKEVLSSSNERLGNIEDILVDANSGSISYAVLAHRTLGVADKYYAIPLNTFRTKPDEKKLVLEMSWDDLKNTPSFDKDHWPVKADARWDVK